MKKTFNFIKRHYKSDGTKKTLILGIGSGFSQLITIISSFIITHYYGPEEVGRYSIMMIVIALLSLIYTLRIDSLILIANTKEEALSIYQAANKISLFVSIGLVPILILLNLFTNMNNPIYLLLPLMTYVFTIYNSDREICLRNGEYKTEAASNILRSFLLLVLQVLLSFLAPIAASLSIAKAISDKASSLWISNKLSLGFFPNLKASLLPFQKYKGEYLPLLKTRFLQNLSNNSIFLYWGSFFDLASLGIFHFSFKVIQLPSILIGDTIYRVFEEDFTSKGLSAADVNKRGLKVVAFVSLCSLLIYGFIFFSIDLIVENLFPLQWQLSAPYIKVIGITILPVALSPILISIFKIQKRSAIFTNIEIIESLIKNIGVVSIAFLGKPISAIWVYSLVSLFFGVIKVILAFK